MKERGERKIPHEHPLVHVPHAFEGNTGSDPFFTCSSTPQNDSTPWARFGRGTPAPMHRAGCMRTPGTLAAVPLASSPRHPSSRERWRRGFPRLAGRAPIQGPAPRQVKGKQIVKRGASYQRLLKNRNHPTCLSHVPGRKRGAGGRAVATSSMTPHFQPDP